MIEDPGRTRRDFMKVVGLGVGAAAIPLSADAAPNLLKSTEAMGPIGNMAALETNATTQEFVDRMSQLFRALDPQNHILKMTPDMHKAIDSFLEQTAVENGFQTRTPLKDAWAINWAFMRSVQQLSDPRLQTMLFTLWDRMHQQAIESSIQSEQQQQRMMDPDVRNI